MIRTLFFDLDDTLLDIAPTAQVIARYSAINQQHWELLEELPDLLRQIP